MLLVVFMLVAAQAAALMYVSDAETLRGVVGTSVWIAAFVTLSTPASIGKVVLLLVQIELLRRIWAD